jgi:hypothetical protein
MAEEEGLARRYPYDPRNLFIFRFARFAQSACAGPPAARGESRKITKKAIYTLGSGTSSEPTKENNQKLVEQSEREQLNAERVADPQGYAAEAGDRSRYLHGGQCAGGNGKLAMASANAISRADYGVSKGDSDESDRGARGAAPDFGNR